MRNKDSVERRAIWKDCPQNRYKNQAHNHKQRINHSCRVEELELHISTYYLHPVYQYFGYWRSLFKFWIKIAGIIRSALTPTVSAYVIHLSAGDKV